MNLRERLEQTYTGPSAWMIRNRVSPNLLMLALLIGGLYMTTRIRQEVFPEISQDTVTISMAYPARAPRRWSRASCCPSRRACAGWRA
jgi:multidrug efflux pump subunit AcrB